MTKTVLRTNATPIYAFLSLIKSQQDKGTLGERLKILDCGAGGPVPPLALFVEHGYEAWGLDVSQDQLEKAREYCSQHNLQVDLRCGDMRQVPYEDGSFDCVYEHYAMCHLSKVDTARAVDEMHRVTRAGGLCFLGVISMDSWPKSLFGTEIEPGEFWADEGEDSGLHSMFTDEEADLLVASWEVLSREKRVISLRAAAEGTSLEDWMALSGEAGVKDEDAWRDQYPQRGNWFNYTHLYYFLRKSTTDF